MLLSTSNFLKTTKLQEALGQVEVAVFEKFTAAYLQQIAQEILLYLCYMKNALIFMLIRSA